MRPGSPVHTGFYRVARAHAALLSISARRAMQRLFQESCPMRGLGRAAVSGQWDDVRSRQLEAYGKSPVIGTMALILTVLSVTKAILCDPMATMKIRLTISESGQCTGQGGDSGRARSSRGAGGKVSRTLGRCGAWYEEQRPAGSVPGIEAAGRPGFGPALCRGVGSSAGAIRTDRDGR